MSADCMHASRLILRIKASLLLALALLLAHGGAMACVIAYLPGQWLPATAVAALAVSLVFHLRRDALQLSGEAVTGIMLSEGSQCELTLRNGRTLTGTIERATFVAPLLTVINVRPRGKGRLRATILMPDSAPAQDLRQVRVWLRHRSRPHGAPGSGPL
jgi:toxin CptA